MAVSLKELQSWRWSVTGGLWRDCVKQVGKGALQERGQPTDRNTTIVVPVASHLDVALVTP